jgi:hypothetical protein
MGWLGFCPAIIMQKPAKTSEENRALKAGLWMLQWAVIIFAGVALFYLLNVTLPSSQDVTKRLNDCLDPKIQRGQYFSDDDGKSAESLLNQCPSEVAKWTAWCQHYSGNDDRTTCAVKVIVLAQTAIKKFSK